MNLNGQHFGKCYHKAVVSEVRGTRLDLLSGQIGGSGGCRRPSGDSGHVGRLQIETMWSVWRHGDRRTQRCMKTPAA